MICQPLQYIPNPINLLSKLVLPKQMPAKMLISGSQKELTGKMTLVMNMQIHAIVQRPEGYQWKQEQQIWSLSLSITILLI